MGDQKNAVYMAAHTLYLTVVACVVFVHQK